MGYIKDKIKITLFPKLTQKGREYYFMGEDEDIVIKKFSLGDSDANYLVAANELVPENGLIPNLTGDNQGCIQPIANGINIRHLVNFKEELEKYCIGTTLYRQVRDSKNKLTWVEETNSVECGFLFRSQPQSLSFNKNDCANGGVGQPYTVSTTFGQFTSTISIDDANQKALDYLNQSGQTIANQSGTCIYNPVGFTLTFFKNCNNTQVPYTVTRTTQQLINEGFQSTISSNDATQKALNWYNNPQNQSNLQEFQNVICPPTSILEIFISNTSTEPLGSNGFLLDTNFLYDINFPNSSVKNNYIDYNDFVNTIAILNDSTFSPYAIPRTLNHLKLEKEEFTPDLTNVQVFDPKAICSIFPLYIKKTSSTVTNDNIITILNNAKLEIKDNSSIANFYEFNFRYSYIPSTVQNTNIFGTNINKLSGYDIYLIQVPTHFNSSFFSGGRTLSNRDFSFRLINIPSNVNVLNNSLR